MSGSEYFLTALRSIAQNKVRALLTTLGVIIGVMSVILLIALGESAQNYVKREFAIMGSNIIIVTPGKQETTGLVPITAGSHRKLTYEIAKAIKRKTPGITGVCANSVGLAAIKYGTRSRNVMCIGTTPDWETIRELHTQVGRFITQQDVDRNNKVVIIGTKLKQELFGDGRALYEKISINGTKHEIVGILENMVAFAGNAIEKSTGIYIIGNGEKLTVALIIVIFVLTVKPAGLFGRVVVKRV